MMRSALAGLTRRGTTFLLVGVALIVAAVLSGQRDLLRVGIFIITLVVLSLAVVVRTRYRVACQRSVEPARTSVGQPTEVVLRLSNVSRLPTGLLLVEDAIPYVLGPRPRFVLDRVESRGVRAVRYEVRSDVRGRFRLGPLTLRLTDPFGLCELTRAFPSHDTLTVTPAVHALPAVSLGGEWSGSGESQSRSVASAGHDDVATREYHHGDELRRVHWRSTARLGQLMVRREEQPWQSRATVLLDSRAAGHAGDGPSSSFEWGVSAAASIGLHLVGRGFALSLLTEREKGQPDSVGTDTDMVGADLQGVLLDRLAVIEPSTSSSLPVARTLGGEGSLFVAIMGEIDLDQAGALVRMRRGTAAGVALLVDRAAWVAAPASVAEQWTQSHDAVVELLRQAGWRVSSVRRGDSVAAAWSRIARHHDVGVGTLR